MSRYERAINSVINFKSSRASIQVADEISMGDFKGNDLQSFDLNSFILFGGGGGTTRFAGSDAERSTVQIRIQIEASLLKTSRVGIISLIRAGQLSLLYLEKAPFDDAMHRDVLYV